MTLRLSDQQRQHGRPANVPRLDRSPRRFGMDPVNPFMAKESISVANENNTRKRVSLSIANVQRDEE